MDRHTDSVDVVIANGASLSGAFHFSPFTMLTIQMPDGWTAADVAFQFCNTKTGTFQPLYDKDNALVQISGPVADRGYAAPSEVCGLMWVKLWSQSGGANVNQAAERTIRAGLKS